MAQNEGVSLEASEQAVSIRIKMKWHKIKECHGNPFIMLAVLQTLSWMTHQKSTAGCSKTKLQAILMGLTHWQCFEALCELTISIRVRLAYACIFTSKCSLCTIQNYSCLYHVSAETEHFVWFAGDGLPLVQKQVVAPVKQNCFRCWSA